MRKAYYFLLVSLLSCVACQLNLKSNEEEGQAPMIEIERYDRLEYRYLTTGDFSALQEMNTEYAIETRTLIEDVLKLGTATDSEINTKLLKFYQDTTLQMLIADAETQYADMEDLNKELNTAFTKLKKWFPDMKIPQVYSQLADGIDELMPKLQSLVDRGYSIAVYPEGTRSKDCRIGRFHKGAFYIAEKLGLDVTPMYLYGPGKILRKKTYHLNKGPIYVEIGQPLKQSELQTIGDAKQQASHMRRHYIGKYEQIANRIEQDV